MLFHHVGVVGCSFNAVCFSKPLLRLQRDAEVDRCLRSTETELSIEFYNHLSDDCEILRQLTHKENMWEWSDNVLTAGITMKSHVAGNKLNIIYSV